MGLRVSTVLGDHHRLEPFLGLAVDINSLANPMQPTFKSDMPPSMVKMWEACGFDRGGRYTGGKDPMHYEYIFRATDVPGHLRKAKGFLAGATIAPPPPVTTLPVAYVAAFRENSTPDRLERRCPHCSYVSMSDSASAPMQS